MSFDEATSSRLAKSKTKQYNLRPEVSQESSKILKNYGIKVEEITDEKAKEHKHDVVNKTSEMDTGYVTYKSKTLTGLKAQHDVDVSTKTSEIRNKCDIDVSDMQAKLDIKYELDLPTERSDMDTYHKKNLSTTLKKMEKNTAKTWKHEPKTCIKNTKTI